ncbi:triose-phosphate isomerase [Afipia carboxidovorans OM5]|uniref:Triosephosphate isomerase n=1 Tax=Afipia carboxidovorans (strain ATCC 49405 / DSM 1227 / KCTC 32145 / OM5) TaxID=504832 RepID=TPIS_AFIC5|nr:triose-phosphate isomerase [Afipia carboxidovorans]B6JFZ2.1 RecName: Full=Triosephosphate isomerase; Short=TIM; Short=TPI; AltName: Full=Triose-phosphate isomerase [Afipia carboxidovorans OM5]ACI93415.1 triose-phosphate isomerase [Afipia carboxidovorans OM5]AEI02870.1 triosephosphate isomerase TpiA [Afipia carboxidovorans OM4]AEI06446.1 triosephosphate isomerase TpiA [Afipia carboxidovorans OM5]
MPGKIRPLIAGNWKMNGLKASLGELAAIGKGAGEVWRRVDLLICPPATLIFPAAAAMIGSKVAIGGQDCHAEASGANTGDISAEMLADAGATYVIVGHSERRTDHGETDAVVRAKAEAAWRAGLVAIVCVGETRAERDAGRAAEVVGRQLDGSVPDGARAANLVVAYEPVWAIGTGLTPTSQDIEEIHAVIRQNLTGRFKAEGEGVRLLYGGSLKPANAAEILALANVNGGLIGGASLKAADFLAIAEACP